MSAPTFIIDKADQRASAAPAPAAGGWASPSRRRFLTETARTACGIGLVGLAVGLLSRQSHSLPADAIRPPGALPEDQFLAACTRCGLCVRDCPPSGEPNSILRLATLGDEVALGTPYFTARTGPCIMCTDLPCVVACPTGALDPKLTDINKARMGVAVLVDEGNCIAFQGLRCEICFNVCPVRGKAIKIEPMPNKRTGKHAIFGPVVYADHCTGCGLCEKACIMEESPIKVLPERLAKGRIGSHYRRGWEEKAKAGKSLYGAEPEHRYNLPEGMKYEHGGRGLIGEPPGAPGSKSAIDTLNQGLGGGK
jgi:ferredoxin-type protein NapG